MIIHASDESPPTAPEPGMYAIALEVDDEVALHREAVRLRKAGIDFVPIREPDAPYNGALMALGLYPRRKEELKRHLSSLRLLR
jgi:hypothetical protein